MSREQLQQYIADPAHGLVKKGTEGNVDMEVWFRPAQLLAAQQTAAGHTREETEENFRGHDYFILNISKAGQELEAYYSAAGASMDDKVRELGFDMGRHLYAVYGRNDTVPLTAYVYQRLYGATGSSSFMLVFKDPEAAKKNDVEICLRDFGLGLGLHKFLFSGNAMEEVPVLKTE
jgi:hypothetical protein